MNASGLCVGFFRGTAGIWIGLGCIGVRCFDYPWMYDLPRYVPILPGYFITKESASREGTIRLIVLCLVSEIFGRS